MVSSLDSCFITQGGKLANENIETKDDYRIVLYNRPPLISAAPYFQSEYDEN